MDADGTDLLFTCGDHAFLSEPEGGGLVEVVNPTSGVTSTIQFPQTIDGDANRPVALSSLSIDGSTLFAAVTPGGARFENGSPAVFEGDPGRLDDAGYFIANANDAASATFTPFPTLELPIAWKLANFAGVTDSEGNEPTIQVFRPNQAVGQVVMGGQRYMAVNKVALNYAALEINDADGTSHQTMDLGPTVVLSVNSDGSPATIGNQPVIVDGAITPGAALVTGGYNASNMIATTDARLALVFQGTGGENDSYIRVFDPANPDVETVSISLIDSGGLNFTASHGVAAVDIDGVPHLVVGSLDGTGRVALINIDEGQSEAEIIAGIRFIGVFNNPDLAYTPDEGGNAYPDVAAISIDEYGRAIVTSEQGHVTTLFLSADADNDIEAGDVGPVKRLSSSTPGSRFVTAISGGNMIAHRPNDYSQVEIVPPGQ